MGEMAVPAAALYGASTQRAVINFPISGQPMPAGFIHALALIKGAAAATNAELGLLEPIGRAGDRGRRDRGGRGPSRSRLPDRHLPDRLGHLDQHERQRGDRQPRRGSARPARSIPTTRSTPASRPTTSSRPRCSWPAALAIDRTCCPPSSGSRPAWRPRPIEFDPIVKTGRTHLQDATPIRLGQEFAGYAGQVEASIRRARAALDELLSVPLGGTAVGTGINAPEGASQRTCARLAHADRPAGPRNRQPLPRPGDARHGRSPPTARSRRSR